MARAVLISIHPEWVNRIISGEKNVEIRKTRPNLGTPFKCYIYETQGKSDTPWIDEDGHMIFRGRGKIVAEFTCDNITEDTMGENCDILCVNGCMGLDQIKSYGGNKKLYGWHISELKIYDTPKLLGEFKGLCKVEADCGACPYYNYTKMDCGGRTVKHPPQSWCYVEDLA